MVKALLYSHFNFPVFLSPAGHGPHRREEHSKDRETPIRKWEYLQGWTAPLPSFLVQGRLFARGPLPTCDFEETGRIPSAEGSGGQKTGQIGREQGTQHNQNIRLRIKNGGNISVLIL